MVASSVVSTILILNYHHRNADTHEMSDWVSFDRPKKMMKKKPNKKKLMAFLLQMCSLEYLLTV